jgi:hypothetical protein
MNANDLFKQVTELDLSPIKLKLMHVESGEGWTQEKTDVVEKEYRRFLCMMKLYPNEDIAPTMDVDTFWHYHILDTMKYAADCEQVFGYFQHHYPYVGLRGGDDDQFRIDSGERMRTLYEATFGEAYPAVYSAAPQATPSFCAGPRIEAAFCAGPRDNTDKLAPAGTAFCAGPRIEAAFCAGPRDKIEKASRGTGAVAAGTAFCAGPRIQPAFCAGPRDKSGKLARKEGAAPAGIAFCAGPRDKHQIKEARMAS